MALTPAEKKRRYMLKLQLNPENRAEAKKKHLERYHSRKKIAEDITEGNIELLGEIMMNKPPSLPRTETARTRDRRRVRRDRSALYRRNLKLQEELKKQKRKSNEYKKRYRRAEKSSKDLRENKYTTLTRAIRDHYNKLKTLVEKKAFKQIFLGKKISKSKMKTAIVRDTLGIDQLRQKQTAPKNNSLVERIRVNFEFDDVSKARAGKRETDDEI
ncbi:hypothetical protein HHI36_013351 [Cryptolaemus montrouzieri]|uniref:Uncharacterized protein n=1 Tax=Cryptolaemus montrouzieri TaxID=559131 RepID=A0ABD2NH28_9CUCU